MEEKSKTKRFSDKKCKKLLRVMRISLLLLFISTFTLFADDVYSQRKEVSVRVRNASLREAFSQIEKSSDYVFLIADEAGTELNRRVNIVAESESINEILDILLRNTDLDYRVVERQVSIYVTAKKPTPVASDETDEQEQQPKVITVKGRVTDKYKDVLPGIAVIIKGTTRGVATDANGNFTLENVPPNAVLTFSCVGMENQDVEVNGRTVIDIVLLDDEATLQEVIITGYQEVKKERMTGSVSSIHSGEIKNLNVKSMDQVLSGTISGVSSVTSGRPGEDARIQIRGINSLTGSTAPIWIVDGMPLQGEAPNLSNTGGSLNASLFQSGIGNLSPDDIESITVLKDAAATAIYGARAANGVIVVKTKSGRAGKPLFNVTAHFGVTERPRNNIRMMNSDEKIQFEIESYSDYEQTGYGRVSDIYHRLNRGIYSPAEAQAEIDKLKNINTDWFKELYRPSFNTQINVSMSGGSDRTQYYNSLNFLNENGTEYNNEYKRMRFSSKLNHEFSSKLKFQTDLSATYRYNQNTAAAFSTLQYALYANPYENPAGYDQSWDTALSSLHEGYLWTTFNAKNEIMKNTRSSRYLEGALNARLDWEIVNGLKLTSQGIIAGSANNSRTIEGANTYTNFIKNWINSRIIREISPEQVRGSLNEGTSFSRSYTFRNTFEYNLNINDNHYLDLFGGQEISDNIIEASFNYSPIFDEEHRIIGFPDLPENTNIKNIAFSQLGNTGRFQNKLSSFFMNGTYSYQDRYVANGSVRYDGSDIIGDANQFTPLWNISGKWNLHKEPYFKSDFFNELSLRVGYGFTGSIDKNAFPFVLMTYGTSVIYDGVPVPTDFRYANPNVKWQTKRDFNIGFETSFFKDKIQLGVNYYNNIVFDLLDEKALPMSSGRYSVKENVANVVNRGWEIDLGTQVIRAGDFYWNLRGNVAFNKNIVTKTFFTDTSDLPEMLASEGNSKFVEGYPVSGWFGYRFAGVNPADGHTMVYDAEGNKFDADLTGNKTLGLKMPDPVFLGDFFPPIIGGLSSIMTFDRWVLTMNFEFNAGNYIKSFNTFKGLSSHNRYYTDANRWRAPGDIAAIPSISMLDNAFSKYMYDVTLEKGDFLRNTYTSLGYNLPPQVLGALRLEIARITFTANNLFTLTAYKGIDPSLMGEIGYPNSRKYSLSINIGF